MQKFLLVLILSFSTLFTQAQNQKKYQSLLWRVSGNGLAKPSYLYGTMHVSEKLVFQLGDPFYDAIQQVDVVALELEPEAWLDAMFDGQRFGGDFGDDNNNFNSNGSSSENFFAFDPDLQSTVKNILTYEPPLLNYMLFRFDDYGGAADFEENTWLDMYIYQTGKKLGKRTLGLETYRQSTYYGKMARKAERNAKTKKSFDAEDRKDMRELQAQIESAYRRQDLDLVDSISMRTNSEAFNQFILVERNRVFVASIDSVLKSGNSIFAAMGCAHLPGKDGVIEMLRQMGFTVEPIEKGARDAKRREKLDKVIFKREYQNYTFSDSVLTFSCPGKAYPLPSSNNSGWIALDIPNGANFSVYRIKTYGGFLGTSTEQVMASIDSILYEATPGDIIQMKKVTVSGFPAVDITNKSRRGDIQRRRIIYTPEEVIIQKISALKDKVQKGYGDEFFNSMKLNYERKRLTNKTWFSPDNSLSADIPGDRTYFASTSKLDRTPHFEVSSYDQNTNSYYFFQRFYDYEPFYLDEDHYIVKTIADDYKKDKKWTVITETQPQFSGNFHFMDGLYKNKKGEKLHLRFIYHNLSKIVLLVKTENDEIAQNYFQSFKMGLPRYEQFYTYTDTLVMFKTKLPFDLNKEQINTDYGYEWESEDDINEAEGKRERIRIMPPNAAERALVQLRRYHKYSQIEDKKEFLDDWKKDVSEYNDFILKEEDFQETPTGFRVIYQCVDTACTRGLRILKQLHNHSEYTITASYDSTMGYSGFVQQLFNNFEPIDTVFATSLFSNGGSSFLRDLASSDSTTQSNAILLLQEVAILKENAQEIRSMIVNLPTTQEKKDKEEIKNNLLSELWRDTSEVNIEFLTKQYYLNSDSAQMQNKILSNLGWMDTKTATLRMKKLLLDEAPIGGSRSGNSSPLNSLRDSLQLARLIFPEALSLVTLDEFEYPTYSLLALLTDSLQVDKKIIEKELEMILLEARNELKRVNGMDEKSYNFSTNALMNFCSILHPFRAKPEVNAFFDKIYKSKKRKLLIEYIWFNEKHGISTPDSTFEFIAEERKMVLDLFYQLEELKITKRMPASYAATDSLLRLYCESEYESTYDNKGKIDKVEILLSRDEVIKGKTYTVLFVKFKKKREMDWRGTVFILPKNGEPWSSEIWESGNTAVLDNKKDQMEELEELYKRLVRSHRKNEYGDNAYEFQSYEGWDD